MWCRITFPCHVWRQNQCLRVRYSIKLCYWPSLEKYVEIFVYSCAGSFFTLNGLLMHCRLSNPNLLLLRRRIRLVLASDNLTVLWIKLKGACKNALFLLHFCIAAWIVLANISVYYDILPRAQYNGSCIWYPSVPSTNASRLRQCSEFICSASSVP